MTVKLYRGSGSAMKCHEPGHPQLLKIYPDLKCWFLILCELQVFCLAYSKLVKNNESLIIFVMTLDTNFYLRFWLSRLFQ